MLNTHRARIGYDRGFATTATGEEHPQAELVRVWLPADHIAELVNLERERGIPIDVPVSRGVALFLEKVRSGEIEL